MIAHRAAPRARKTLARILSRRNIERLARDVGVVRSPLEARGIVETVIARKKAIYLRKAASALRSFATCPYCETLVIYDAEPHLDACRKAAKKRIGR